MSKNTTPAIRDAIKPDAVIQSVQAPAYVDAVRTRMTSFTDVSEYVSAIDELRQGEASVTSSFVVAKVTTWDAIGTLLHGMYVTELAAKGEPAPDETPGWSAIKRYLAAKFTVRGKVTPIGGYALDSLQRPYNAFQRRTVESLGRWLELCTNPTVVASGPRFYKPESAVSALDWSGAVKDKRIDRSGRVLQGARGSNREGTGAETRAINPRLTVSAATEAERDAKAAAKQAADDDLSARKARLVQDPRAQLLSVTFLTGADLTSLSLDDLQTLRRWVDAAVALRSAAPVVPADVTGEEAAAAVSEPAPAPRKRAARKATASTK